MAAVRDRAIWSYALACGAAIVTKDQDFANRQATEADGPPIVGLRCGNTRRRALLAWFEHWFPTIVTDLERGASLIEIA